MHEGERYTPRKMSLDALIEVLVDEHSVMKEGIQRAREAAARKDFEGARAELQKIDPVFRQHIADEESQILGLLVRELGARGAAEEIKVFQQHRPIYQLMKRVGELASMSSAELETNQDELKELFDLHAKAEETKVFPRAASLQR
jgi:hemerythrin-like domain-containing protein